ncbi:ComEC/Rec2 family competence protein [Campylobacter jejuni]|uniref:ComEC/Rec2 family competence protein n=1 Tax=Campylobacter jejuni TaxID=197 RepID=UPI0007173218|nr:MBL fold metallo-hydrolase [Campylobacter jejuni]EFP0980655.1 MBL fold metallo-hydrolase [Campylobacter jejuni]EKF2027847.1 MBL fold metallo-hydrolase [Campylobacter jejuni]KAJ9754093.1 MBL fold metallo-hydrolase [Campylobacter jejuni]KRS89060.1 hypothetical protein DB22_08505 [Campylobacter jejuni]MBR8634635.1 MBL fold metallo-hydrolase [Campylobacter jejuni]
MNNNFGYEIEFIPVGSGRSGDAILVRYGVQGNYKIMIVDGGTKESGENLVDHVKKYYKTNYVDYVVNTHPDQDHASGLTKVLNNLEVGELWIHCPWNYAKEIIEFIDDEKNNYTRDQRITFKSFERRLAGSYYKYAKELENIAKEKNITIKEPYKGCKIGDFEVLSPSRDWHLFDLIINSDKTEGLGKTEDSRQKTLLFESLKDKIFNVVENLNIETLKDGGVTSRENESSVILYANFNGKGILLTGDAGNEALEKAYNFNPDIYKNLSFIQIPHHGSRKNNSPKILNQIIGKIGERPENSITAFVSAGENDENHPRRMVVNAFIRRGCKVIQTKGKTIQHFKNMPEREGWVSATPLSIFDKVESYE